MAETAGGFFKESLFFCLVLFFAEDILVKLRATSGMMGKVKGDMGSFFMAKVVLTYNAWAWGYRECFFLLGAIIFLSLVFFWPRQNHSIFCCYPFHSS